MQRAPKKPTRKRIILGTVLIFLISYFIFLILWIQVKDNYGYAVTYMASKLVTLIKDVRFEEIKSEKTIILATFSPVGQTTDRLSIPIKTSSYTFNAPLTFGIMAALFSFIKRRGRAYAEGLLILFGVHLLYVFSLEAYGLTTVFIDRGLEVVSKPRLFAYEFLWRFTDNMVLRFEPFLIGFYLFIRFRR